jgi:hypothetical protein
LENDGAHRAGASQSKQASGRRPPAFVRAERLFSLAGDQIALLERCRPVDGRAAIHDWLSGHRRGERRPLAWRHRPAPDLGRLRCALEREARELLAFGPIGALYAERAAELELEARLAERVGQASFAELARRRHAEGGGAEWPAARQLAAAWTTSPSPSPLDAPKPRYASDDRRSHGSLYNVLAREIGRRRLPLRLELVPDLASRAACGDGVVFVGAGHWLSAREARRIALHELLGHALPRLEARRQALGLARVGSARANDDEEGRAVDTEAAHDLLDDVRRRELGLRHQASLAVAAGAEVEECVALLQELGCDSEEAVFIYARVARGGGLCREIEYLPAWLRFAAARDAEPDVARWLAHGRLSLAAARVLLAEGIAPERTDGTFSTCHSRVATLPRSPT